MKIKSLRFFFSLVSIQGNSKSCPNILGASSAKGHHLREQHEQKSTEKGESLFAGGPPQDGFGALGTDKLSQDEQNGKYL